MKENQNIEWKETWRDEYLKWVCGFANADGGVLVVGRDDKGRVTGLHESAKLMEDIPNKVRDILGIMVKVRLREESGKEFLEAGPKTRVCEGKGGRGGLYWRSP